MIAKMKQFARWTYRSVGEDGLLHIVLSALLASVIALLSGSAVLGALVTMILGVYKEIVVDSLMSQGDPSFKDLACDLFGVAIMYINHI